MKKLYKIDKHNSTVCGYPGRDFDWSKFCWDGSEIHVDELTRGITIERKSLLPWVDDGLIGEGNQYLHVPYEWAEDETIYRVRPNESMRAGRVFWGRKILRQKAILENGVWYWELEFTE